jgi:protein-tyrosine phosphatase
MRVTLADERRILPIECGFNFRDFGGYATADGAHVRHGLLYRAGVMAYVEGEGRDKLAALRIATICDLRSSRERHHRPTRWHEELPVELWSRDYGDTAADLISAIETGEADGAAMRDRMFRLYRGIAFEHAPSYRALFELLGAGKVPLVVNCSAGKDRTGTAVALVLSALDVPRETIMADYMLTGRADFAFLMKQTGRASAAALPTEALKPLLAADPDYLQTMFDVVEARCGSVPAYLESELGVGPTQRERLRELLVEA